MKQTLCIICALIGATLTQASTDTPSSLSVIRRLKQEKIHAITCGMGNETRARKLTAHGLNVTIPYSYIMRGWKPGMTIPQLPRFDFFRRESQLARTFNIVSLPHIWFHNDTLPFLKTLPIRHAVTAEGKNCTIAPCPQDQAYWQKFLKPILKELARIQKNAQCQGGALLDMEFYTGELIGGYTYGTGSLGCFCDTCFGGFLKTRGQHVKPQDIPYTQRWEYILKHASHNDYLNYLSQQVTAQVKTVADQVRTIKPDFLFAIFGAEPQWYTTAILRAFSQPNLPALLFSSSEYFTGYNQQVKEMRQDYRKLNLNLLIPGGLTISSFNAEGLAAKTTELADKADGYWLYYGEVLMSGKPKIVPRNPGVNEYILREPQQRYWKALKTARLWRTTHTKLPELHQSKQQNILTPKCFGTNADDKGLLRTHTPKTGGILLNEDLKALDHWTNGDLVPTISQGILTLDLTQRIRTDMDSLRQIVPVIPKQTYRIRLELRQTNTSSPFCGLEITEHYSKNCYFRHWINAPSGTWKNITRTVTPYNDKIQVRILYAGKTGTLQARNIHLEQLQDFDVTSKTLPEIPSKLFFHTDYPMLSELINPETGLGYFNLSEHENDLRYLKAIFPNLKAALRFSGQCDADMPHLPIQVLAQP